MSEKIYFPNSKGNKLCGILSNPRIINDWPIVILCHGFTTSKDSLANRRLEEILNKQNIATLRIDLFAHGESEGHFEEITVSEAVDDIINAIKYTQEQGFIKIGLVGSSFSGIASTIATSKIDCLSLLVLKSPVSNYEEVWRLRRNDEEMRAWKERGYDFYSNSNWEKRKLNYSFVEDFANQNAYEVAKSIKIPTLIIHGDADITVPIEQSKKLSSILSNWILEIISGADHKYSRDADFEKMLTLITDFVVEYI